MANTIPGVGRDDEEAISTLYIRSVIEEIVHLDLHKFVEGTVGNLLGISRGALLIMVFIGLLGVLWQEIPNLPLFALAWVLGTAPLWILPAAIAGGWKAWIWYVQSYFIASQKTMLLEVKIPRELVKSPRAMEAVLSNLWLDQGETTFFHRKWKGQLRPIFSLEIASFGGSLHFYVWTRESHRKILEASFYAQYPEIELVEVEDYASKYEYDPKVADVYAQDYRYEPLNDAYPIKTYIEFELEKDPKEEYKVDPMAEVVEFMGNIWPDEEVWFQIVFTVCKDYRHKKGGKWFETESRYVGLAKDEAIAVRKDAVGNVIGPENEWKRSVRVQYYRQTEQVRAIERNMGKHPFNVGVRGVYIAAPKRFNAAHLFAVKWMMRPYGNAQYLNQLRPRRWHTPFDYPWQDMWDLRWDLHSRRFFDCYRRRQHFYAPHVLPYNMMSTEVIATLWHPPSTAIKAPGIDRVPAKKAEPPPNLPM